MMTSTGCCLRSACVSAVFRKLAIESDAVVMRMLSMPAETEGPETATIRPMRARTTTISSSVTPDAAHALLRGFETKGTSTRVSTLQAGVPAPQLVLPTDDVCIQPFATGLAVAAEAD